MLRALISGADSEEICDIAHAARRLFGPSCSYLALELDTSSVDPALAWGTASPVVGQLIITDADQFAVSDEPAPTIAMSTGVSQPLGEDGDAAPTILDIAHRFGVDVIVIAVRHQGWLARTFSGSAANDLLRTSDIPVLMVNLASA